MAGDEVLILIGTRDTPHPPRRRGQVCRNLEPIRCVGRRRLEQRRQRQVREPVRQRNPSVDATRYRRGSHVTVKGHPSVPVGSKPIGISPAAGPPRGIETSGRALAEVDQREQIATHAAHVLGGHRQNRRGRNGGIHRVATQLEHSSSRRRRPPINRAHRTRGASYRQFVHVPDATPGLRTRPPAGRVR